MDTQGAGAMLAQRIWGRAVAAVAPDVLVSQAVKRQGELLVLAGQRIDLRTVGRLSVLGVGKAAAGMVKAMIPLLHGYRDRISGLAIVPSGGTVRGLHFPQLEAAHPIPNGSSLIAADVLERLARGRTEDDLVFVLLSGGASALVADPVPGVSLADLQAVTTALLASGKPIGEVNTVRKHLSRLKGGQLARLLVPAKVVTLVISDVVDDRLDVIGSGPTVADSSTFAQALAIVMAIGGHETVPSSVLAHLRGGAAGAWLETPRGDDSFWARQTVVCIGGRQQLLTAAAATAAAEGLVVYPQHEALTGEAAQLGDQIAVRLQAHGRPDAPTCWIATGEPTVTLGTEPGQGGRCQEVALAAAVAMDGTRGIGLFAAGSDGIDGPTDAAGAWVDGATVAHGSARGRDARQDLRRHDAYGFFAAAGGLWLPGPTGTNVGDLVLGFRWP